LLLDGVFELYGQSGFRRLERQALESVLRSVPRFVMATSGSIVSDAETFGRLLSACRTVWLRASPGEHMDRVVAQGDLRPMADNRAAMADLKAILANREAIYSRADWAVETSDRDVDATIAELVRLLPP
jgi:XRE family aerobic/anaerobic benzoate catabolism transcriptional regulator